MECLERSKVPGVAGGVLLLAGIGLGPCDIQHIILLYLQYWRTCNILNVSASGRYILLFIMRAK